MDRAGRAPVVLRWGAAAIVGMTLMPAAAHATATIAADTTRSSQRDPVQAGRATSIWAGGFDKAQLRFQVRDLQGPVRRATLRLKVQDPTTGTISVRPIDPAFPEDAKAPAPPLLSFSKAVVGKAGPATAGTWLSIDVTKAVTGNGDVGLQVEGPFLDPARFSSREGPDAPQLVVDPADPVLTDLAAQLDPRTADRLVLDARDDLGRALDGLDVALSPDPTRGRYLGVHHAFVGGVLVTQVATSDDLVHWRHAADLAQHGSQPSIAVAPDGSVVVADEEDHPDPQWVSTSTLRVQHYATVADLLAARPDRVAELPRTLAPTAEGTPTVEIVRWGAGPDDSELRIRFHEYRDVDVDRQAVGTLTNFSGWTAAKDLGMDALMESLGVRGNVGDRAELPAPAGRRLALIDGMLVKGSFQSWRLYLADRDRNEAMLLPLSLPGGSYAFSNPSVRVLPAPSGAGRVLFFSAVALAEGSAPGEAGEAIVLRALP